MAVRKVYQRAEQLLLRDKQNQTQQISLLADAIKRVLFEHVAYDRDSLCVTTHVTDKLTLYIQVDIKGFKKTIL